MDWIHLHLALNHVPVLGSLFVGLLLFTGLLKNSQELCRLSLWWLVALSLISVPIKFTGDFAWEKITENSFAEKRIVSAHEQAADQATTGIFLAGIIAMVTLYMARKGKPVPRWGMIAALVFSILTFCLMARTANLGGLIRHPEIRNESFTDGAVAALAFLDVSSAKQEGTDGVS